MTWGGRILSFAHDERVLSIGIGLIVLGIVSTVNAILTITRDDNAVAPKEPKTQYITQETEDSLKLGTLQKLLTHPNFSIREVATKILCDRAVNDHETLHYLLYGITRPEYDERMRCLRALALLTVGNDGLSQLNNDKAYSAIVRSLELSLEDCEPPDLTNHYWDEYFLRDMAERFCLMFVHELINKNGTHAFIRAKFVEKWLAKQDWGDNPDSRRRNFRAYMDLKGNRIVDIVDRIKQSRRGMRVLERAGLVEKDSSARRLREVTDFTVDEEDVLDDGAGGHARRPASGRSWAEQRLRRQHREAMVLNDGLRPLGREHIIERERPSPG